MRLLPLLLSFIFCCAVVENSQAQGGGSPSATYDNVEFIFGHDNVCSGKNEKACIVLGSPWNERAIKKALPGYKVTYSNECDGFCFLAETEMGILEVLGSEGKVALLRSLWGSVDFRGNNIGDKLRNAVADGVTCSSGLNFVCTDSTLSSVGYIVDGCDDKLGSLKIGEGSPIPDCATISGFQVGRLEYLEDTSSESETSSKDEQTATQSDDQDEVSLEPDRLFSSAGKWKVSTTHYSQGCVAVREYDDVTSISVGGDTPQSLDLLVTAGSDAFELDLSNPDEDISSIELLLSKARWADLKPWGFRGASGVRRKFDEDVEVAFSEARSLKVTERGKLKVGLSLDNAREALAVLKKCFAQDGGDGNASSHSPSSELGAPYKPDFDKFPALTPYSGQTKFPDFDRKDRQFREYRTKIREKLSEQRRVNFAGSYNLVHIGLTGGLVLAVVDSATGRIKWLDSLGGGPYYDFAFRKDSRLVVVQWSNSEDCYVENYEWTGSQMRQIGEGVGAAIDDEGFCKDDLPMGQHR